MKLFLFLLHMQVTVRRCDNPLVSLRLLDVPREVYFVDSNTLLVYVRDDVVRIYEVSLVHRTFLLFLSLY